MQGLQNLLEKKRNWKGMQVLEITENKHLFYLFNHKMDVICSLLQLEITVKFVKFKFFIR